MAEVTDLATCIADAEQVDYPSFGTNWYKRWCQLNSVTLHRVASTVKPTEADYEAYRQMLRGMRLKAPKKIDDWDVDGGMPRGIEGTTACGRSGRFDMPGIFSRMGAPRCRQCCKKVGIPPGDGAPFNNMAGALTEEQRNA